MSVGTMMSGRAIRQRVTPAVLMMLAGGLVLMAPSPQVALAASQDTGFISAGAAQTCVIESGQAFCWGDDGNGYLGTGTTSHLPESSVPVPTAVDTSGVLAGKTLTQISVGSDPCALDTAGTAYCWGDNTYGALGDGTTNSSSVPVAVDTSGLPAGTTFTQISVGIYETCALDSAGSAYCWGYNAYGQLGDGNTSASSVPVAVDTSGVLAGKTLTKISAGDDNTCALDSTGAAYCWGYNGSGALGDGTTTSSLVPVAVDTNGVLAGKTLTQMSAGDGGFACALDSSGAAYCWGYNPYGALGDGTTNSSSVPVAVDTSGVLAGKTLTRISANGDDTCALDGAGAAYCWGGSSVGALGDGTTTSSTVPVAVNTSGVLAGKTLTQISVGDGDACALDSAGAVYCWGGNFYGQLGDDLYDTVFTNGDSHVPVLAGPQAPTGVTATGGDATAAVSWTAPASLDTGTLTGYTATASPGGETCTTTGATACTITGLADGTTYSITVVAQTTAGYSGASTPVTVVPAAPQLAIDQVTTRNGTSTVTTAPFTTTGPRLLVAFTSSDGGAAKQATTVTGAGLTWTLVKRANTKGGTAEIWTAQATGPLTNATVTSIPKAAGYDQSLTVVAFTGASGIGASASAGKSGGVPTVSVSTTQPGSWVFGVGEDYTNAIARTLGANQSLIGQWVDPGPGETFWVQDETAPTPVTGTAVTINDTAPKGDSWNLAAAEILPAAS